MTERVLLCIRDEESILWLQNRKAGRDYAPMCVYGLASNRLGINAEWVAEVLKTILIELGFCDDDVVDLSLIELGYC